MEGCRVATDFDLEIARSVGGIEWTEKRQERVEYGLPPDQSWKVEPELLAGR